MDKAKSQGCIYVFAGTNGAGKSSVLGEGFTSTGAEYFNPDLAAKELRLSSPSMSDEHANSAAWSLGRELLERAITERGRFAFETTLGGSTITGLLERAIEQGLEVRVKFVGLSSPELHIARVHARVARGGHDIPEEKIRERYHSSRLNLIRLLPKLTELLVHDNSAEADPQRGVAPRPMLLLHMKRGRVLETCDPELTPNWAKPILLAALKIQRR